MDERINEIFRERFERWNNYSISIQKDDDAGKEIAECVKNELILVLSKINGISVIGATRIINGEQSDEE